ncbi:MAG: hypothetical protein JST22_09725 [Bacteroidetes bacterium]|nr:hypothetical protein [Bacteroidota bacterium]
MSNINLHGSGLFGRDLPAEHPGRLPAIRNSGFTAVMLGSLHVGNNGDPAYNNSATPTNGEFVNRYSYLPDLIASDEDRGHRDQGAYFDRQRRGI